MRIRLRARVFLLALLAVLPLMGCSQAEEKPEEFRIGLMAPLNSPTRFTMHRVAQARVDELNAQGGVEVGGRKMLVRLIVEDSGNQVEQAMSAMSRLVQQERVSAIIGPIYSRDAIPVAAALETLQVPMITPSASNPEVTRGRKFAFRVCQVDSVRGPILAYYAYEDMGLRRIAVLYDEADAYSSGLARYFRDALVARSGAKAHMEPYQAGTQNFMPHLARVLASGAQVLFLPNFPADLARQIQQARAAGFVGQFLGGESWDTDRGFHSLPEAQGAVYETDFATAAADPKLLAAAQALAAKSGSELDKNTALTLDALGLLFAAAKSVGSTDPVSLRSGLVAVNGFEGLTGRISYNGGGDPETTVFIMGITGGQAKLRESLNAPRQ